MYRVPALLILFFSIHLVSSGQLMVSGIVLSKSDKVPLPGVNIVEKGTQNGTSTDLDGKFNLSVSDANSILVFSALGHLTQEIEVGNQEHIKIMLKPYCHVDWFDSQKIGLYVQSGLIDNPVGGEFFISFPAFLNQAVVQPSVSYQTDFNDNYLFQTQVAIKHLVVKCNFDLDIAWNYKQIEFGKDYNSSVNSFETDLNFSHRVFGIPYLKLILGYSNMAVTEYDTKNYNRSGGVLGLGFGIGKPINATLIGKANIYAGKTEYQVDLLRNFKQIQTFIRYYNQDTFSEFSIGLGYIFDYRFKRQ